MHDDLVATVSGAVVPTIAILLMLVDFLLEQVIVAYLIHPLLH